VIYLASPYSHPDPAIREQRFQAGCQAAAALLRAGHIVFSPVIHSHVLVAHGLPSDWEFWKHVDREHLERCDEVVVLMLDGWEESVGVAAEIRIARELGKRVRYLTEEEAHRSAHGSAGRVGRARVAKRSPCRTKEARGRARVKPSRLSH
jgi:nucleoside 2-deoxyribosyltransferase